MFNVARARAYVARKLGKRSYDADAVVNSAWYIYFRHGYAPQSCCHYALQHYFQDLRRRRVNAKAALTARHDKAARRASLRAFRTVCHDMKELLVGLEPAERQLAEYVLSGSSLTDIGAMLGISRQAVAKRLAKLGELLVA